MSCPPHIIQTFKNIESISHHSRSEKITVTIYTSRLVRNAIIKKGSLKPFTRKHQEGAQNESRPSLTPVTKYQMAYSAHPSTAYLPQYLVLFTGNLIRNLEHTSLLNYWFYALAQRKARNQKVDKLSPSSDYFFW